MKKILLGTSALAAVALSAGAATAEAPTVTLTGGIQYAYVSYDNDKNSVRNVTTPATAKKSDRGGDIAGNGWGNELQWTIKGVSDSGLEYTGRIDWRYDGSTIDESWIKLGGGWGNVVIGADDAPSGSVRDAYDVAAGSGGVDGYWMDNVADNVGDAGLPGLGNGDSNKIAYYSPDFSGFSFGVSYTPKNGSEGPTVAATSTNEIEDQIDAIISYNGSFDDVTFGLDAAYSTGSYETEGSVNSGTEDLKAYHIGGVVTVSGFSIGAGYSDHGDSGTAKGIRGSDKSSYNLGVKYNLNGVNVSATYTSGTANAGVATGTLVGSDDTFKAWSIGADYVVADGLGVFADFGQINTKRAGGKIAADKNKATVFLIGTKISF